MHLSSMITHLTLNQSQIKCTVVSHNHGGIVLPVNGQLQIARVRNSSNSGAKRSHYHIPTSFQRKQICQPFIKDISAATRYSSQHERCTIQLINCACYFLRHEQSYQPNMEFGVSGILGKRERELPKFPANDQFASCFFTTSSYSCLSVVQFVAYSFLSHRTLLNIYACA